MIREEKIRLEKTKELIQSAIDALYQIPENERSMRVASAYEGLKKERQRLTQIAEEKKRA
jgi:hypothetical protein